MTETHDELKFAQEIEKLFPIIQNLSELMKGNRMYLTRQKYQIDNNHLQIQGQLKEIAENNTLIDATKSKAASIIALAEEKAADIDKAVKTRLIQVNYMEKEAKKKLELADRAAFNSSKRPVEA